MISYYIAGPAWKTRTWEPAGVFAVDSNNPDYYVIHPDWPTLTPNPTLHKFGRSLECALDEEWWIPLIDEDLRIDEGL